MKTASSFPKICTCCGKTVPTRKDWAELVPARGGLLAHGLEWRNHGCGGTLTVTAEQTGEVL